jgi:hypothetical protein
MEHSIEQSFKIEKLFLVHSDSPWGVTQTPQKEERSNKFNLIIIIYLF